MRTPSLADGRALVDRQGSVTNSAFNKDLLICASAAAILLSGCAYDRPAYYAEGAYPVYYDGYYGPIWDGFWGADGFFNFIVIDEHHFRRDDGHHFRREATAGFHAVPPNSFARRDAFRQHSMPPIQRGGEMRMRHGQAA
jgi:hypothetical protein